MTLRARARSNTFVLLLVLAGALTYANSLRGPFVFDDRGTILDNTQIESLDLDRILSPPAETPVAGRPVVNATFALNYAFGERNVVGYHVAGVAIHIACGLVLFAIVLRTSNRRGLAFAVALIWMVHPLASEAVDYISQRTESLMALFYLLTLYASIRALGPRQACWSAIAVVSCALGMASKESMVTAPLVVLLYDRVFLFTSAKEMVRSRGWLYGGLAATWLVLAALMSTSPRGYSAGFSAHDADAWTYLLNQAVMVTRYLRLSVWPRDLVLYYGVPRALTVADVWPHLLVIGALLAVTIVGLVRRPQVGFLGAWFFITLAPTSSIVPISTEVGAERRMYLPLMALVALVVIGSIRVARRAGPRIGVAALVIVAGALASCTVIRNREYTSSLTLAETSFARWPSAATRSMLGMELAAAGRFAEAETHLRQAAPEFPPARYYLGLALMTEGHLEEAAAELQEYIRSQPVVLDQVRLAQAQLTDIHRRLANALMKQQSFAQAIEQYRLVLAASPDDAQALAGVGVALATMGKLDQAIPAFRRAAEIDSGNSHAHYNLARALGAHGDLTEAIDHARRAVELDPADPAARELLRQLGR